MPHACVSSWAYSQHALPANVSVCAPASSSLPYAVPAPQHSTTQTGIQPNGFWNSPQHLSRSVTAPLGPVQSERHPNVPFPVTADSVQVSVSSGPVRPRKQHRQTSSGLPSLGYSIPNLPLVHDGIRKEETALEDILFLWEHAAPELGVHVPLRDWKWDRTDANQRSFAAKYQQRKAIAEEYIIL